MSNIYLSKKIKNCPNCGFRLIVKKGCKICDNCKSAWVIINEQPYKKKNGTENSTTTG